MATVSAEERRTGARAAAHHSWANTADRTARTEPGRAALLARFAREIDPDGELPEHERNRRAEHRYKAHFLELARKSVMARRKAREAREAAARLDAEAEQLATTAAEGGA